MAGRRDLADNLNRPPDLPSGHFTFILRVWLSFIFV